MRMINKLFAASAGLAAIAAAGPASAQYYGYGYQPESYQSYGYGYQPNSYQSYGYGYNYGGANSTLAAQQCTAAVQNRLYNPSSIGAILGAVLGTNTTGQVLSITRISPRSDGLFTVRGLATSGRYAYNDYGSYGVGAYGALGYGYANAADLSFRCVVAPNGAVYNVSINRRY